MLAPLIQVSRTRAPLLSPRQWFTIFDRLLLFTDTIESRLPKDLRNPTARNAYRTDKYIHRDLYRALFATIDAISPRAADWSGPLFMAVSPTDEIVDSAATKQFFDATQPPAPNSTNSPTPATSSRSTTVIPNSRRKSSALFSPPPPRPFRRAENRLPRPPGLKPPAPCVPRRQQQRPIHPEKRP